MKKVLTLKNLTKGNLFLSVDCVIKKGGELEVSDLEFSQHKASVETFVASGFLSVHEIGSQEAKAQTAAKPSTPQPKQTTQAKMPSINSVGANAAEDRVADDKREKIKAQLKALKDEFEAPKTPKARKDQIALEVSELKKEAKELKLK
jgi:ABC-type uncharacterized transport system involved in gliding motility auxiliary subunit